MCLDKKKHKTSVIVIIEISFSVFMWLLWLFVLVTIGFLVCLFFFIWTILWFSFYWLFSKRLICWILIFMSVLLRAYSNTCFFLYGKVEVLCFISECTKIPSVLFHSSSSIKYRWFCVDLFLINLCFSTTDVYLTHTSVLI